eukprot:COSAG01_NODE_3062_length_6651_cov_63.810745_4_plen_402_part_00
MSAAPGTPALTGADAVKLFRDAVAAQQAAGAPGAAHEAGVCSLPALRLALLKAGLTKADVQQLFFHAMASFRSRHSDSMGLSRHRAMIPGSEPIELVDFVHGASTHECVRKMKLQQGMRGSEVIGKSGGNVSVQTASVTIPAGCVGAATEFRVADLSGFTTPESAALSAELGKVGTSGCKPCSPMLKLEPHGTTFKKPVTLELDVPLGSENLPMVLMHRDADCERGTHHQKWQVLSAPCRPVPGRPGRVAVQVKAFCFVVLSFPFSGMESLKRQEFSKTAPVWRRCGRGMNLDVTCSNSECKAHGKRVLVQLGLRNFDFKRDWEMAKCPQCRKECPHGPKDTVLFTDCCWKFEGELVSHSQLRVRGEIMGSQKYRNVGESQYYDQSHYLPRTLSSLRAEDG